jgi:DNA polymerase
MKEKLLGIQVVIEKIKNSYLSVEKDQFFSEKEKMEQRNKSQKIKKELSKLYADYSRCKKCPLHSQGRKQIVFGEGDPSSGIVFIGEGPGKDEDIIGKPFVGRAGKLLTKLMEKAGIKREEIYITNVVKCRPPGNRTPAGIEITACASRILIRELEIIKPKIICCLGATAARTLLGKETRISKIRGKIIEISGIKIIPTYHPAYLLRNPPAQKEVLTDFAKISTLQKKSS